MYKLKLAENTANSYLILNEPFPYSKLTHVRVYQILFESTSCNNLRMCNGALRSTLLLILHRYTLYHTRGHLIALWLLGRAIGLQKLTVHTITQAQHRLLTRVYTALPLHREIGGLSCISSLCLALCLPWMIFQLQLQCYCVA